MNKKKSINFTITVCTFNQATNLSKTLESINNSDLKSTENIKLIVVDNNSNDNTKEVCEYFSKIYKPSMFNRNPYVILNSTRQCAYLFPQKIFA